MGVEVGVEGRVEVNRRGKSMEEWKKGGRMYAEKNTEKKILLFRCRSLNPRGKKLKEWRHREETEI